jgi:sterol desaturase/sphingolipid hydroxylase (fatty acid hydroxylase superfamily)
MPDPGVIELRFLGMLGGLLLLLLLAAEWSFPLRRRRASFWPRLAVNFLLSVPSYLVAAAFVQPIALAMAGWSPSKSWGLLVLLPPPPLAQASIGILLMDLSFYYWHRLNHRVRFLWRFHNVHHIDPDLDVTTAVRFHFGEIVLSAAFRVLQVSLIGVGAGTYLLYEFVFQANTLFQHSNVRLPIRVERILVLFLVTPRMHGIHHSAAENETNSDYSAVFSWWDRLHRTLRLNVSQSDITIGVPGYLDPQDNRLWNCLRLPFSRQRDYWRTPEGSVPSRNPSQLGARVDQLAK